jgi:hypothetical protein
MRELFPFGSSAGRIEKTWSLAAAWQRPRYQMMSLIPTEDRIAVYTTVAIAVVAIVFSGFAIFG